MRGRPPKPTAQRVLEGNAGKRAINAEEPQPPLLTEAFDTPPPELGSDALAAAEWRRLAPMLRACRQISEADRGALIALCLEWARYLTAMKRVQELGLVITTRTGYPMTNPYLIVATKALAGCNKLWPELGLTPSSRSRVKRNGPGPAEDPFHEFDSPPPLPTAH